jgi:hypothetical protein
VHPLPVVFVTPGGRQGAGVRNDRKGVGFWTTGKGVDKGGGDLGPGNPAVIVRNVSEPRALLCEIQGRARLPGRPGALG